MRISDPDLNKPEVEKTVLEYCQNRVPDHIKDKLWYEYEIKKNKITLIECRPYWRDSSKTTRSPFARIDYDNGEWLIFWMRASGKWHLYEPDDFDGPCESLEEALKIIDSDSYGCFYG